MAPSVPHIAAQLRQLIYYHLDNNLLRNALFLAGRLVAYEGRSADAAYLFALCQYQSGLTKAAWDTCRPHVGRGAHLGCAYIYAQACLDLGRNVEGLTALDRATGLWRKKNHWNQHTESRRQHLPDEPAVLCLKGKLWKEHKNMANACECWSHALRLNPFMWDAFMHLCDAGAEVNVSNVFKMNPTLVAIMQKAENESTTALGKEKPSTQASQAASTHDPFVASTRGNGSSNQSHSVLGEKWNGSKASINTVSTIHDDEAAMDTPTIDIDDSMLRNGKPGWEPPAAPLRKARSGPEMDSDLGAPPKMKVGSMRSRTRTKGASEEANVLPDPALPAVSSKRTVSGQVAPSSISSQSNTVEGMRRSNRLNTRPATATATHSTRLTNLTNPFGAREGREIKKPKAPVSKQRIATAATVGRVVSGNRTRTESSDKMDLDSKDHPSSMILKPHSSDVPPLPLPKVRSGPLINKEVEALHSLFDLFTRLADAQLSLTHYDTQSAIQTYNSLHLSHRDTPYVTSQIAMAYYEQASYAESERYFIRLRTLSPSHLPSMEYYSTVLWHTKNAIELAYLSHELTSLSRLSPQSWCAIGNTFSLQRDHESALRCFHRATQLDPSFSYGFTLQGHEYISNEEFEKALAAYRAAIAVDPRHYNAWYGLGRVYEKMGKWKVAEQHYRTASSINPSNAVLVCCIGVVLEKCKLPIDALEHYTRACVLAPNSALSRFKKARCLMALGRLREALSELKVLKDMVPDEANVHFLLGRVYKSLRVKGEAVRAFTMALNLDPKAAQFIKDAMESLDDDDDDDEEGEDDDIS